MTPIDYPKFYEAWLTAHAMSSSNQVPADNVVMAVFDVLAEYPLEHVGGALRVHARRSRFAPTPADIEEIIGERTGRKHIGPDEAWMLALASMDEAATVVLTREIAEARGAVWETYVSGDKTGARMAFRDAYTRIVATAPDPIWFISEGHDAGRRLEAIEKAVRLGRLPVSITKKYRIDPAKTTVAGLVEQAKLRVNITVNGKLRMIKQLLADDSDNSSFRHQDRQKFEAHRQEQLRKIEARMGE